MPGARPSRIGATRRHTAGIAERLRNSTYRLMNTSTRTSAGLRMRLLWNSSATGTVSEEKP
jgi:hypothetical protein